MNPSSRQTSGVTKGYLKLAFEMNPHSLFVKDTISFLNKEKMYFSKRRKERKKEKPTKKKKKKTRGAIIICEGWKKKKITPKLLIIRGLSFHFYARTLISFSFFFFLFSFMFNFDWSSESKDITNASFPTENSSGWIGVTSSEQTTHDFPGMAFSFGSTGRSQSL